MGLVGIKGQSFNQKILKKSDLIISLGCRLSPALIIDSQNLKSKNKKKIIVDIDRSSLNHPLIKFDKNIKLT